MATQSAELMATKHDKIMTAKLKSIKGPIAPVSSVKNIQKIIEQAHDSGHPVDALISALIEKNRGTSRSLDVVDHEALIIDLRYAISQINRVTNELEVSFIK